MCVVHSLATALVQQVSWWIICAGWTSQTSLVPLCVAKPVEKSPFSVQTTTHCVLLFNTLFNGLRNLTLSLISIKLLQSYTIVEVSKMLTQWWHSRGALPSYSRHFKSARLNLNSALGTYSVRLTTRKLFTNLLPDLLNSLALLTQLYILTMTHSEIKPAVKLAGKPASSVSLNCSYTHYTLG